MRVSLFPFVLSKIWETVICWRTSFFEELRSIIMLIRVDLVETLKLSTLYRHWHHPLLFVLLKQLVSIKIWFLWTRYSLLEIISIVTWRRRLNPMLLYCLLLNLWRECVNYFLLYSLLLPSHLNFSLEGGIWLNHWHIHRLCCSVLIWSSILFCCH